MHEKYGDIVRIGETPPLYEISALLTRGLIGPNEVSIRDVSCITPLLGSLGCPKGPSKIYFY
jgi:hypothetical protein